MNSITITSKEISSLKEMDSMFEGYCNDNKINLDFTKGLCCNGYLDDTTGEAFCWFMRGVLTSIGYKHLERLL